MPPTKIPLDTDSASALRDLVESLLKLHGHDLPAAARLELHMHLPERRDLYDSLVSPTVSQSLFPDHAPPFRTARITDNAQWPAGRTSITLYSSMTPDEVEEANAQAQQHEEAETSAYA